MQGTHAGLPYSSATRAATSVSSGGNNARPAFTARTEGVPPCAASVWQSVPSISWTSTVTSAGNRKMYAMEFVQRCGGRSNGQARTQSVFLKCPGSVVPRDGFTPASEPLFKWPRSKITRPIGTLSGCALRVRGPAHPKLHDSWCDGLVVLFLIVVSLWACCLGRATAHSLARVMQEDVPPIHARGHHIITFIMDHFSRGPLVLQPQSIRSRRAESASRRPYQTVLLAAVAQRRRRLVQAGTCSVSACELKSQVLPRIRKTWALL